MATGTTSPISSSREMLSSPTPWRHAKGPFFSFILWCALAMFFHYSSSCKLASVQKIVSLCYWLAEFCKSFVFLWSSICMCLFRWRNMLLPSMNSSVAVDGWGRGSWSGGCGEAGVGGEHHPIALQGGALVAANWISRAAPPHRFCQPPRPSSARLSPPPFPHHITSISTFPRHVEITV
jgi:hypothetical protein